MAVVENTSSLEHFKRLKCIALSAFAEEVEDLLEELDDFGLAEHEPRPLRFVVARPAWRQTAENHMPETCYPMQPLDYVEVGEVDVDTRPAPIDVPFALVDGGNPATLKRR